MKRFIVYTGSILALGTLSGAGYRRALEARALQVESGPEAQVSAARKVFDVIPSLLQTPLTEPIDISAEPAAGNRLGVCRLVGHVTLWVSRPLRVLDDMQQEQAVVEAGLLQFGERSRLEGCVPDSASLDLSEQFGNFVVTQGGAGHREKAIAVASQLAQDFFHFADADGTVVPLVAALRMRALGSVAHEYTILLIRDTKLAAYDAVILRETVRTKFSPRLADADRHLSRVKWSSFRHD